jgi:hypothetical protein
MKFKLDALVHLHYEETLIKKKKKKKELQTCSKDLDNLTYGLFKKPGRYIIIMFNYKLIVHLKPAFFKPIIALQPTIVSVGFKFMYVFSFDKSYDKTLPLSKHNPSIFL